MADVNKKKATNNDLARPHHAYQPREINDALNTDASSCQSSRCSFGLASSSTSTLSMSSARASSRGSTNRMRHSLGSSGSVGSQSTHSLGRDVTDYALRARYLHRLGIDATSCSRGANSRVNPVAISGDASVNIVTDGLALPGQTTSGGIESALQENDDLSFCSGTFKVDTGAKILPSCCKGIKMGKVRRERTRRPGRNRSASNEFMLLKSSLLYTTELKFDKSDPTDVERLSTNRSNRSVFARSLSSEDNDSRCPSTQSSPKFELSSAWTSYLAKVDESTSRIQKEGQLPSQLTEPLDGAFDLFSLPSDTSISSNSKITMAKPQSPDSLTEPSTSFASNTITLEAFSFASSSLSLLSLTRSSSRSLDGDRQSFNDDSSCNGKSSHGCQDKSSRRPRRKVSFAKDVCAATIPSRYSYSPRIRSRLWTSAEDIYVNALRNEIEFAYDGNNWRRVREEGDFVRSAVATPAVRPITSNTSDVYDPTNAMHHSHSLPAMGTLFETNCPNSFLLPSGQTVTFPAEELIHPAHLSTRSPFPRGYSVVPSNATSVLTNSWQAADSSRGTQVDGAEFDDDDEYSGGMFALDLNLE